MGEPPTIHYLNWKTKSVRTVCGLPSENGRQTTTTLIDVTCNVCALRLLREGQKHGLDPRDLTILHGDKD